MMNKKNISEFYGYDSNVFIFTMVILIVQHSKYKIEMIKLFILVPLLLENLNEEILKTKSQYMYFIEKAENAVSKSSFYGNTLNYIKKYREDILESIILGLEMNLFYLELDEDLYLCMDKKRKFSMQEIKNNETNKRIIKLLSLTSKLNVDAILKSVKVGE